MNPAAAQPRAHFSRTSRRVCPNAAAALAVVRDISENWPHRPWPYKLRCVPVRTGELQPRRNFVRESYRDLVISRAARKPLHTLITTI